MWKPTKGHDEIKELYFKLAKKYKDIDIYGRSFDEVFKKTFFDILKEEGLEERERIMPTEIMQMYSELGVVPDEDNSYLAHLNNITNFFGVDRNILEVAGGAIPTMSNIIARKQLQLSSGTITMVDPFVFGTESKYSNLKICKQEFNELFDVKQFDLIIGIMSCGVTDKIIEAATKNNKDFYIAMCGCGAEAYFSYYYFDVPEYNYLIPYAKRLVEENNMGNLEITYLDDKYDIPFPIIYNKRK